MPSKEAPTELTKALEDYLETIYELVRDQKFARVKDIVKARGVRAGSVSPAMRRLSDLGLIEYAHREYIGLTPRGEQVARRVYARHQLLTRFFEQILAMPSQEAESNACAMEHSLSPAGMEHLVRFFEFLQICPEGRDFLTRFHACSVVHDGATKCTASCEINRARSLPDSPPKRSLWDLDPGQQARIAQIEAPARTRQQLLDKGFLPGATVSVDRLASQGDRVWISLGGFEMSITRAEAQAVLTTAIESTPA